MAEASWIASILAIGCLMGNLPYGFAMNRFGRKWPLICLAMPMIGSWFLIIFAQRVTHLYIARLIVGIVCGGILMNVPVYIVEIANHEYEIWLIFFFHLIKCMLYIWQISFANAQIVYVFSFSIRGILSSVVPVGSNSGVLLAYVLGNYSNYIVTPIFAIISMALFAIVFSFLPETPIFLVKKNRISVNVLNPLMDSIEFIHIERCLMHPPVEECLLISLFCRRQKNHFNFIVVCLRMMMNLFCLKLKC